MRNYINIFKGIDFLHQFSFILQRIREIEKGKTVKIDHNFEPINMLQVMILKNKLKNIDDERKELLSKVNSFVDSILKDYYNNREDLHDFFSVMRDLPRSTYKRIEQRVEELDEFEKYNL